MGPENKQQTLSIVSEIDSFLKEKYPIKNIDVEEILDDLHNECKKNSRFEVVSRHVDLCIDFASQSGLKKRAKGKEADVLYIPGRMAAIVKFENEKGADLVKQLPLSRQLGILAIGEITSVRRGLHLGWKSDNENILEHLNNFNDLVRLQTKLKKSSNSL